MDIAHILKDSTEQELIELYFALEKKVLPLMDELAEQEALQNIKDGKTYTISSGSELKSL